MSALRSKSVLSRTWTTPVLLIAILVVIAAGASAIDSGTFSRTITEIFIRVTLVVGMFIFIGNSGVISFGHTGFMCLGAYAAAWFTIPPMMKSFLLPGLPGFVANAELPVLVSAIAASAFAGTIALIAGSVLMRLSGIAASIGTFAFLAVVNTIYSNWESVTAATSSVVGIPIAVGIWSSLAGAVLAILVAYFYGISKSGLALRAARDEAIAAEASGVNIYRERLIAFVLSAVICGLAGVLYAHFLGVVNPDAFYLGVTFVALSMLVVGGMGSLSGAVVGVVVISAIIQLLRWAESGLTIGENTISLPNGIQEIVIGIVMIIILILRPSGLMRGRDLTLQKSSTTNKTGAPARLTP